MAYSDKVIDHYENPRNVGAFDKGDDTVGTGMVGAPACGDVMKLQIKVNPATGLIEDMAIRNTQIAEELALPPVKIHCSILAEDAIKAAVNDYKARHGAEAPVAEAASLNA
jgi:nitrogen fixation NifU-like protein